MHLLKSDGRTKHIPVLIIRVSPRSERGVRRVAYGSLARSTSLSSSRVLEAHA